MIKYMYKYALFLMVAFCTSCGQNKIELSKENIKPIAIGSGAKTIITSYGPQVITRNIIQDRKGNIWMAAFDGIFKYDGKSFTNITSKMSSARFFSVLEDSKGNLWFGSIGSGVYYYPATSIKAGLKSFQNLTTRDGLLNNEVGCIYEDKRGKIWFGVSGGASCYDGKSFRNYIIDGNAMNEDKSGKTFSYRPPYEVTSIIEDKTGKFWFATRGNTFVYNGKTFSAFSHDGKAFKNVRSIIKDKKGNIWLGGNDGLWRYNGSTFINFTQKFAGHIIEDKKGNIWTSSASAKGKDWALSRYDENSLSSKKPVVTEIKAGEQMIFGILEAYDRSIWFGTFNGAYRYDGKNVVSFSGKKVTKYFM